MTEHLFYLYPYLKGSEAVVQAVEQGNGVIRLALDRTIFYPEGGGQPSDRGVIEGNGFRVLVDRVYERDRIWHEGKLEGRLPEAGERVRLVLDWDWRYENMKNHTGQHILSAVLKNLYGLDTTGFQIFDDYNKIEVNGELDWEMITRAEIEANSIVWEAIPVTVEEFKDLPDDIARTLRKHVSKVTDRVRIVMIGDIDRTPCGGTHVRNTSEIGLIKVLRFYRKSKKLWRIEFVAGNRALKYLNKLLADYWESLDEMPNKNRPLVERVKDLKAELDKLEEEKDNLRKELWEWKAKALLDRAEEIGGVRIVSHIESADMKDAQAFVVYLVDKNPGTIALVVGKNYVIFAKNRDVEGISMNELLKEVLAKVGGGGGGGEMLARGGGFKLPPEDVLRTALNILKTYLS
ncbi:alanyl-tRNA editing protein AlaX [Thermococcus sp. GR7]|uniref:alanyl-tRNA editing protein n=1 Tax=unclassified Thermococcus TaxID=2627626 RepID=UPI00142F4CCD|nr:MULTISPECIES: DHHA1 domain-containing protein [unclassified Thermococcus]NJE46010.1 alanyl-tRNA editing protein AlaX [Thermococcus sp. GR7]NJE78504.1 alanyl-tRNA editing protein AlaX [Thermococcus sp. GR4]NJF22207.1 alanyl-tRNA editing protein AlaX [Thermococcus sp. GR5]